MTRVSVIITCYNLGAFLLEALNSALGQSHPDCEVLLVDDGSSDPETIAVLDRLLVHPRLRVLRSANQGVARARNYGISEASGEYILPLDADDRIHDEYVARAAAILDTHPEVGFVGCHYRIFGLREAEYRPEAYCLPDMLVENVVPIASMFRRSAWREVGGYCPDLNSIEDWDLWLGIMRHGHQGVVIPEILFDYRVRSNSNLSHMRQPELYQQRMRLLYARHATLYEQYQGEVLLLKDLQFARQNAYTHWLEEQRQAWEETALRHLARIEQYDRGAAAWERRRIWWRMQVLRVQRVMEAHPTVIGRVRALLGGVVRVARRRLRR